MDYALPISKRDQKQNKTTRERKPWIFGYAVSTFRRKNLNIGQTEKATKTLSYALTVLKKKTKKNTHMTKRESRNYSATPLLSSKPKYT